MENLSRTGLLLGLMLAGCKADHGFSPTEDDVDNTEGNGAIEFTPEALIFTEMATGATYSDYLKLQSVGDNNLELDEVRILNSGGGVFYMEQKDDIVLAPGSEKEFTITATLAVAEFAEGSLRIKCNDLETPVIEFPLEAWPAELDPEDTGAVD